MALRNRNQLRSFRSVRATEVVEASGSILFRNVKIETGREGPQPELAADVTVKFC